MEKTNNIDLSIVDIDNPETAAPFPLYEKPVGAITYEHVLPEWLFKDVFISTAERNYFVDRYHELCICVHFNRRIPETYTFDNKYHLFVTKQRMCLDIHWNLGNITDEKVILEKYVGIEEAKQSSYYDDFCDLIKRIEESIEWKKDHIHDPYAWDRVECFGFSSGNTKYECFEVADLKRRQIIQFYFNESTEEWESMSLSQDSIIMANAYIDDFADMDKNELHIRDFIPIEENALDSKGYYHELFKRAEEYRNLIHDESISYTTIGG